MLSAEALDILFRKARTAHAWLDRPVSDELLGEIYDLMRLGPTSANSCPARMVFLRTPAAKERLLPALSPGNVEQTTRAPVTAIVAYDLRFYEKLPKLFPHNPKMAQYFSSSPAVAETTAFRNGTLQGGYLILAARSLGLDCGPMSGFDNAKVDQEFFSGSGSGLFPGGQVKSNFLCNLGYADHSKTLPRQPRLDFDEACKLL